MIAESNSSVKRSTRWAADATLGPGGEESVLLLGPRAEPRMRRVRYASELLLLSGCYAIRSEKKCSLGFFESTCLSTEASPPD